MFIKKLLALAALLMFFSAAPAMARDVRFSARFGHDHFSRFQHRHHFDHFFLRPFVSVRPRYSVHYSVPFPPVYAYGGYAYGYPAPCPPVHRYDGYVYGYPGRYRPYPYTYRGYRY